MWRTTMRTTRFVSIARRSIADIFGDPLVHSLDGSLFWFAGAEDRSVNVFGGKRAGAANDNFFAFFLPFQNRARTDTELPAHVLGNRNLVARCNF